MFDQTFVDDARKGKEPVALAVSVLLELFVLGLLALIPLIYTEGLPTAQLKNLLTAPPALSASPKSLVPAQPRHILVARRFPLLIAPSIIPRQINPEVGEVPSVPAPDLSIPEAGLSRGPAMDGFLSNALGSAPQPPPAPVSKKAPSGPVRIGGAVAEANLIRKVLPVYPPLAKSARVQGSVEFSAIISTTGDIENLRVVHGHPLLIQAAKEAVLQWKYRPTLLNGQPVKVVTDIIVNFTLSQ